ncbi:MAG: phytoene desaturase family protein [Ferruginibacter sp.]
MNKVVVIGSGFAGLSAASFMAKAGWDVTVLEKHNLPGGRARKFSEEGFNFDMGPSWYWMPDVFERYFNCFEKKVTDYYSLKRLSPSYRVYYDDAPLDIPADYEELKALFESLEKGAAKSLDDFLAEAAYKYEVGINKLVHKPGRSLKEFFDLDLAKGVLKLDVFTSMKKHISKYFKHPKLVQLMEFPVLFLGALPQNIPALYSLMNYADIKLGTWYPQGGMYAVVQAMFTLAKELGVKFHFNCNVTSIEINDAKATGVKAVLAYNDVESAVNHFEADVIIGAADYHFIENELLPEVYRSYSEAYWDKRVMAPSCLLYYIGLNKKLKNILHHSLFFDVDFDKHGKEIYEHPQWPAEPLFYVSATSVTDKSVAPEACENLFFLIPVAAGLKGDTEKLRDNYFDNIIKRFEKQIGEKVKDFIIYKKTYAVSDFVHDYNAYKGNAYGLANTLMQTAILKPSIKSKKVKNLFYTGQLTVPGPGVPPSLISGEVVAKEIVKAFNKETV